MPVMDWNRSLVDREGCVLRWLTYCLVLIQLVANSREPVSLRSRVTSKRPLDVFALVIEDV